MKASPLGLLVSATLDKFISINIDILEKIYFLIGVERLPFVSLSAITSRHSSLRTTERARMPETALLSASQILIFHQNSSLKTLFLRELKF